MSGGGHVGGQRPERPLDRICVLGRPAAASAGRTRQYPPANSRPRPGSRRPLPGGGGGGAGGHLLPSFFDRRRDFFVVIGQRSFRDGFSFSTPPASGEGGGEIPLFRLICLDKRLRLLCAAFRGIITIMMPRFAASGCRVCGIKSRMMPRFCGIILVMMPRFCGIIGDDPVQFVRDRPRRSRLMSRAAANSPSAR